MSNDRLLTAAGKLWKIWHGRQMLSFIASTMFLLFFEIHNYRALASTVHD